MKTTIPGAHHLTSIFATPLLRRPLAGLSVALLGLALGNAPSLGTPLIWDPSQNGSGTAGSGNWDTASTPMLWYNGTADVAWGQTSATSPTQGATFNGPDAADGTYVVTLDAGGIAVTNLNINANGYTFAGANALYLGANNTNFVAANKTVTFNCNIAGSGTSPVWLLGSGATMNVGGNFTSGQQVRLAGAAGSSFNLTGANAPAIMYVLSSVNVTAGSLIPSSSFYIGYNQTLVGTPYGTGTLTVSGSSTVVTINGNFLIIGRSGGTGTLVINDGTVNAGIGATAHNLAISYDVNGSTGIVNVNGGTLNVGTSSTASAISFFQTGGTGGGSATLNQTAGILNAWGGMVFGFAAGTGENATWTQTGGTNYLGQNGIAFGSGTPTTTITLSGGTVGTLASWSSSLPITLGTVNGNITFQCAEANGTAHNITLSGALTGAGGLNVTGGGILTLSGANNYAGSTVISNGTFAVVTRATPIVNGPVTVDASTASPVITVNVSNPGQYWTNNGALTFQNGTATASFQFGALAPSTTVAPIQVNGAVAFTATPNVVIGGTAIANGTYPLIKYTGSVSGTLPSNLTLPGYISAAYVTNLTASKTVALVVTGSTYNPALYWRVGSGIWDINTTANWTQFGNPAVYTDGSAVIFDDSASGPSPITVTLNTVVNPLAVTANNATNSYTITGTGSIAGSGTLQLLGSGSLTLTGTNVFNGGTVVSSGQLNINAGGDPVNGTPIGLGPLTLNPGAKLDNTSGSDVSLQAQIAETWNGNFSYVGASNSFNTGSGLVTMNGNVSIAVSNNTFTVGGQINDNGGNLQLSKTGNGTLTLGTGNGFTGGLALYSGLLNLGDPSAAGTGVFAIYGGALDNSSGADMILSPLTSYTWGGSFTFLGSANLDLSFPNVNIPNGLGSITLTVVTNTLTTEGDIVNNNTRVVKSGAGTWTIGGSAGGSQSLGLLVTAGQVNLDKNGGQAITGGNNVGLTVQTGGTVVDLHGFQIHSAGGVPFPVVLAGGIWDLNGFSENVDLLTISSGGKLRNGAATSTSSIRTITGYTATLSGPDCEFDVTAADAVLNFNGALGGSGSLVKTGLGLLNLNSNDTYTGSTT
ncbi:MAG TPA: autotransporter-associated beta strand repeat-containing protein, partial [Candidatus Acidoferrum sp.]|nr:autotransporter-associated beta strand repeat-containing protein [Candidatus Acidoferrum sp.]